MQPLPHRYKIEASAPFDGDVAISCEGLETLPTAPPAEYGGPGDRWSPETLLVASVVDCFVLTFRAIARASSLVWSDLSCDAEGELERVNHVTRFTGLTINAHLSMPEGGDPENATRLLYRAKQTCLVSNSLAFPVNLEPQVRVG